MQFSLKSSYIPTGDQPEAISNLVGNLEKGIPNQVLLGVTGSGKSVAFDTEVLIKNKDNKIVKTQIGEHINKIFDKYSSKINKTNTIELINTIDLPQEEQIETYSFNPITKDSDWKKVTQYSRHQATDLFEVITKCGRNLKVSGDHNFFVLQNGKFKLTSTKLIKKAFLPIPRTLNIYNKELNFISLLEYGNNKNYLSLLNKNSLNKNEVIKIIKHLSCSHRFQLKHKGGVPFNEYQTLFKVNSPILNEVCIRTRQKKYQFPLKFKVTDNFLKFLGYYIGEGHATKSYITVSTGSKEALKDIKAYLKSIELNIFKRLKKYDYQISSKLFSQLLSTWCGHKAQNKKLPPFAFQFSNRQLALVLKTYFSADGGINGDQISVTTASKTLASEILYSLLRYSIVGRLREKRIRLPYSFRKKTYYEINISGCKNLNLFKTYIGFSINKKNEKLITIIKNHPNTNVDLIPCDGKKLLTLRKELDFTQKNIASCCQVNRSYISMIESNKRKPSIEIYDKITGYILKKAKELNNFEIENYLISERSLLLLVWTPVKNIKKIAIEPYVYDFSVEDNETFLAGVGGLFVHNTFSIANVIQKIQKPTLIISHNKTLAAQLYQEFREFFPDNAVSYFVSYYDYYQPEAYIPQTDTYIEKETDINEEIDKLRLQATTNILTRKDTIIVASVSCIYNLGSPIEYGRFVVELTLNQKISHDDLMHKLSDLQYERSDFGFHRSTFRVRGEALDIFPSYEDNGLRVEIINNEIKTLYRFDPLNGKKIDGVIEKIFIYPAKHYVTNPDTYKDVFVKILADLDQRVKDLKNQGKDLEAHRISQKVHFDLEMLQEIGYVNGIENYSRYFDGRKPNDPPFTLFDYFNEPYGKEWLLVIDESHMTIPQVKGMYRGDNSRKQTLIDFGFRLPSALDNRPLRFDEFERRMPQTIFVSATPDEWEISYSENKIVEQLVRPTGIPDPLVEVRPTEGQIDDLIKEIESRTAKKERVLVTTLTKRMAEELTDYLKERNIKVHYLHSDIETLKRTDILEALREGLYDVVVGINLLREGLDLPEVTLVAILDADKEGFLRSRTSLIQTMGRAARNINSVVIMYADKVTNSMKLAIEEVERRRNYQLDFNQKHKITPTTIIKSIRHKVVETSADDINANVETYHGTSLQINNIDIDSLTPQDKKQLEKELKRRMNECAKILDFEAAAKYRDYLKYLKTG